MWRRSASSAAFVAGSLLGGLGLVEVGAGQIAGLQAACHIRRQRRRIAALGGTTVGEQGARRAVGAATLGPAWALLFAGALSGAGGQPPGDRQIDAALQRLEESVKAGDLAGLIPFDRQAAAVQLL